MKTIGIIKRVDALGQITLPKEIRQALDIKEGDAISFGIEEDNSIILKKCLESNIETVIDYLTETLKSLDLNFTFFNSRGDWIGGSKKGCNLARQPLGVEIIDNRSLLKIKNENTHNHFYMKINNKYNPEVISALVKMASLLLK